jgi:2-octaprenyl-6-methoxyphenol hydroxylase
VHARLVVAADGDRSLIRERAGLCAAEVDYAQVAIVANVAAERRASGVAYERFGAAAGPIALLPRPDGHYTVVWSVDRSEADVCVQQPEAEFLATLQQAFGWRVGAFTRVGQRAGYPLLLRRATQLVGPRTVLVGNAAQSLHPVAGQGFNLGLRDAATLAELLAQAAATGADPGARNLLASYAQQRQPDRSGMIGFTDSLVRLFALSFPGAASLRNAGLLLFDALPAAKRGLSGVSWGFGARTPRLLRGLPGPEGE